MSSSSIPTAVMSFPTRMIVGPGALSQLADEVRTLGAQRALIVSDEGLVKAGVVARVQAALDEGKIGHALYTSISKNPKERDVLDGVEAYLASGAALVIGLGGGAAMDVAKLIRLKVTHPLPLEDYDDTQGGSELITEPQPPMIAVPTTAGTGSEVGRAGVVSLGPKGRKVVIFAPSMLPEVALCDAELTVGLPAPITAATGIDALTHAIEAYVGQGSHPLADAIALASIARVGGYLAAAVHDGTDLRARHEMMVAASMGAIAFQKNLGACHALAHPLSSVCDLHHGLANALMLPHVIRFNTPVVAARYDDVATALGAQRDCASVVTDLIEQVGLPTRLRDVGVKRRHFKPMVAQAIVDASAPGNPRELTAEHARELYEAAF